MAKTAKKSAVKRAAPAKAAKKANPLESVMSDLRELAKRDDVPKAYAGRLEAIANRIDTHVGRSAK